MPSSASAGLAVALEGLDNPSLVVGEEIAISLFDAFRPNHPIDVTLDTSIQFH